MARWEHLVCHPASSPGLYVGVPAGRLEGSRTPQDHQCAKSVARAVEVSPCYLPSSHTVGKMTFLGVPSHLRGAYSAPQDWSPSMRWTSTMFSRRFLVPQGRSNISPRGFQVIKVGGHHCVKPKGTPIHSHFKRHVPPCAPGGTSQPDVACSDRSSLRRESTVLYGTTPGVAQPPPVGVVVGVTSHEVFFNSNCYREIKTTNECSAAPHTSSIPRCSTNVEQELINIEAIRPTEHMT